MAIRIRGDVNYRHLQLPRLVKKRRILRNRPDDQDGSRIDLVG